MCIRDRIQGGAGTSTNMNANEVIANRALEIMGHKPVSYTHLAGVKMMFVLAKKRESTTIFRFIKDIEPNAFVSQSAVIGVFGEGFDRIKVKYCLLYTSRCV